MRALKLNEAASVRAQVPQAARPAAMTSEFPPPELRAAG
jgi:hypothetical protein